MMIQRIWKKQENNSSSPWIIWDNGNTFWELKENIIRCFQLSKREFINNTIVEICIELDETPIPSNILCKREIDNSWEIEESIINLPPTPSESTLEKVNSLEENFNIAYSPELWSCLSQWIPVNALFQPHLYIHHQANQEINNNIPVKGFVKRGKHF